MANGINRTTSMFIGVNLSPNWVIYPSSRINSTPNGINTTQSTRAYIKDFKTSNVQHTNEVLPWLLGLQGIVDPGHHPVEHLLIHGFGQGSNSINHLEERPPVRGASWCFPCWRWHHVKPKGGHFQISYSPAGHSALW